jgi:hypothetical protein
MTDQSFQTSQTLGQFFYPLYSNGGQGRATGAKDNDGLITSIGIMPSTPHVTLFTCCLTCFNALSYIETVQKSIFYFPERPTKLSKTPEMLPLPGGWTGAATCGKIPRIKMRRTHSNVSLVCTCKLAKVWCLRNTLRDGTRVTDFCRKWTP